LRKNNKVLVGLLIIVLLAVIGLSAYAYQKQKSLNNVKPKVTETKKEDSKFERIIKESSSNFNKENELSKKIDILKNLLTYKEEISKENKDKLNEKFNSQVKEMREKIKNSLKDNIGLLTVSNEDKTNTEKITNVNKELTELQTLVDKEKETIFDYFNRELLDNIIAIQNPVAIKSKELWEEILEKFSYEEWIRRLLEKLKVSISDDDFTYTISVPSGKVIVVIKCG